MPESDPRRANWSRFWRHGALHSLSSGLPGNYDGDIRAFWSAAFDGVAADGRVLDLGTGNGPLPALLHALRGEAMPAIDAVDLADVSPAWTDTVGPLARTAIRFHGGVSAEALPFEDARFDLAVSQYGLEYMDMPVVLAELARVVRRGGRLALLLHHADGRLAAVAREERRHAHWLLEASGLVAALEMLLPFAVRAGREGPTALAGDAAAAAARDRYNASMQALSLRIRSAAVPDLLAQVQRAAGSFVAGAVSGQGQPPDLRAFASSIADGAFRSDELVACALDADGLAALAAHCGEAGFAVDATRDIRSRDHVVGWTLAATRR